MARLSRGSAAGYFFGPRRLSDSRFAVSLFGRQPILLILLAQAVTAGVVALMLALWQGQLAAVSALLGGAIAVVPNAFLAARLLKPQAGTSAQAMLKAAWIGEVGKVALTALLFAAVFVAVRPLSAVGLFAGFVAAQLVIFGAPLIDRAGRDGKDGMTKN
jgi:ATP synthase protein I